MVKTQTEYQKAEEDYQAEQKRFAAFQQEYEKKVSDILKVRTQRYNEGSTPTQTLTLTQDFQILDENRLSTIHGSMRRSALLFLKTQLLLPKLNWPSHLFEDTFTSWRSPSLSSSRLTKIFLEQLTR